MGADGSFEAVKVKAAGKIAPTGGRGLLSPTLDGVLSGTCRADQFFGCLNLSLCRLLCWVRADNQFECRGILERGRGGVQ